MEAKENTGVYEGWEKRDLMDSAKGVLSELSFAKWNSFLKGSNLRATGGFSGMYSSFTYDVLHNPHLGIYLTLKEF